MALTVGLWMFLAIMVPFLVFAVLSNAVVVYCVCRIPALRSVTNVLIGNLALSDILLAGFVMPQKLHDISHEEFFHEGDILCKIVNFCPIFVITSSIYTLVCVSFERRRAIIDSASPQMTKHKLRWIVPAVWSFGLLVSIPTVAEYSVNEITIHDGVNSSRTILSCGSQHRSDEFSILNAVFVALVSYLLPVVLMFKNYIQVALFVWKRGKQINVGVVNSSTRDSFRLLRSRIKIVKMLVIVAVIFAVSWLPFFITLLYAKITHNDASNDASGFINLFLIAMATFSTAYNVILYVIYNPGFRKAIKDILRCTVRNDSLGTTRGPRASSFILDNTRKNQSCIEPTRQNLAQLTPRHPVTSCTHI